jgi:hypothetical protein
MIFLKEGTMKKVAFLSVMIFVCLCCSCALRKAAVPSRADIPVQCDLTYDEGVVLYESLHFLIQQKLKDFVDEDKRWSRDGKKVKLLVRITRVEVPSSTSALSARLTSVSIPPGKIFGEVSVYSEDREIRKYGVYVDYKTFWPASLFVNPEEKISDEFTRQVMNKLNE